MAIVDLTSLLTGATGGGNWTNGNCDTGLPLHPDTVDFSDPTSVDFTGKSTGVYVFNYYVSNGGCVDCEKVTVIVQNCTLSCTYEISGFSLKFFRETTDYDVAFTNITNDSNTAFGIGGTPTITIPATGNISSTTLNTFENVLANGIHAGINSMGLIVAGGASGVVVNATWQTGVQDCLLITVTIANVNGDDLNALRYVNQLSGNTTPTDEVFQETC